MKVLVGFATAHGSTEKIATQIAETLAEAGLLVDLRRMRTVVDFGAYDAMVLGSAVHDGRWLPGAAAHLLNHAEVIRDHPTWLFSVSTIGATSSAFNPKVSRVLSTLRHDSKELVLLRTAVRPREHRHFAGVLERGRWNTAGRLFFSALGGRYGDHLDVQDISSWGDVIARTLAARERLDAEASEHESPRHEKAATSP